MKKLILIILLAVSFASCEKSEVIVKQVDALSPKVNLLDYDTQYIAGRNQFYMQVSMENIEQVSKVELVTLNFNHNIPVKTEKQIVWVAALADTNRLKGAFKFTMKNGSFIFSEPFDVQY